MTNKKIIIEESCLCCFRLTLYRLHAVRAFHENNLLTSEVYIDSYCINWMTRNERHKKIHLTWYILVGDISLKIWANCANSDTSMKISDKHYDSISFTYGLLAINFFHFFKMATVFFKMTIFFHIEYTFQWNTFSDTLFISIKTTTKYNRDALFSNDVFSWCFA